MSNHYHLVLRVDRQGAAAWSHEEIVERWTKVFGLPTLIERWREGVAGAAERAAAKEAIESWRTRLSDVSWYMRCLNEYLARRANAEDECTGRFWEGRFKSQALLDEAGLLTAMAYVDLNPVRAGIAATPEESEFTSIHARILQLRSARDSPLRRVHRSAAVAPKTSAPALLPFRDTAVLRSSSLPMSLSDYRQLLDWSARMTRPGKKRTVNSRLPAILTRLNIDADVWQYAMRPGGNLFGRAIGRLDGLRAHAERLGQAWIKGLQQAGRLYRGVSL